MNLNTGCRAYSSLSDQVQFHDVTAKVLACSLLDPAWNGCGEQQSLWLVAWLIWHTNNRQMPLHTPYRHSFVSTYYNDNKNKNTQEKTWLWHRRVLKAGLHNHIVPPRTRLFKKLCMYMLSMYLLMIEIWVWVITTTEQPTNSNNHKEDYQWVSEWVSEWVDS